MNKKNYELFHSLATDKINKVLLRISLFNKTRQRYKFMKSKEKMEKQIIPIFCFCFDKNHSTSFRNKLVAMVAANLMKFECTKLKEQQQQQRK